MIDGLVKRIGELKTFDLEEMFGVVRSQGRSLELTEDRFWSLGYGSDAIHLLFNLWYRDFNYTPAYDNNLPQVDHIFPQSRLKQVKIKSPETGRPVMKYRDAARNQLANCMLLTREEKVKAEDMGSYFRVPADNRDLNYNVYFAEGEETLSREDDYHSHNTERLDVDGMIEMLLKLEYVRQELDSWRPRGRIAGAPA